MKKPKINFSDVIQVKDGEPYRWYRRIDGTYVECSVCCDCQLVHTIEMKPNKRYMRVKVWREEEKTKELRKRKR
jgi:hypothetical protein